MLIAVVLLALAGSSVFGKLVGENICQEERRFKVNVTEYFLRNRTVRNYEWCMNVPPRCSFYTIKITNESRVVEKEVTDLIETCCSGYKENKDNNRCTPFCPLCLNGTCVEGKCECFPGFKGEHCNTECDNFTWGKNCEFSCECNENKCEAKTGKCKCSSGSQGDHCQFPCDPGFYGPNCLNRCRCDLEESCDPMSGQCLVAPPLSTTLAPPTKIIEFSNNGKFNKNILVSTEESQETVPVLTNEESLKVDTIAVNNYMSHDHKINNVQLSTTSEMTEGFEENFLNDEKYRGNTEISKSDLVSSASAATAISVGVIVVAAVILATNHFKKKGFGKNKGERNKAVSTLAVYTHSIFHTPLPEPPVFESPIFSSPLENPTNSESRFEAHVVCSMNFPPPSNTKDYLYDHPPSTGSYRAASIPEPPDDAAAATPPPAAYPEPLYDEIPSGGAPAPISEPPPTYKPFSLYMNTCGKTRL